MVKRWTKEQANAWYAAQPWITGFNYYPRCAVNQTEIWQEYRHEAVFDDMAQELALAQSLGLNALRTIFPFELWLLKPDVFFRHVDEFLALCNAHGLSVMPVLFDDCCVPKSQYEPMHFGPQPKPEPGYFGGSSVTCFTETVEIGYNLTDAPGMEAVVREYIHQLAQHYGQDSRILIWNVWNEPGNSKRENRSLPMMYKVFEFLRAENVSQPLTADVFAAMPGCPFPDEYLKDPRIESEIELAALELSDIITFHYYGDYVHMRNYIRTLKKLGRPVICDEWLHRPMRSFIQTHLPLLKKERVGSYFFGFVNGKMQFNEPWEYLKVRQDMDFTLWMHDIFHNDFTPYDDEEINVLKACNFDQHRTEEKHNVLFRSNENA